MRRSFLIVSLVLLGCLSLWELLARASAQLAFLLPAPSQILLSLFKRPEIYLHHTLQTLQALLAALVLAFTAAFPLAVLMLHFRAVDRILHPLFLCLQCLPMFALAPLMILWFGWSALATLIPSVLILLFPLTLNIYKGLASTPQELLDLFRSYHASSLQILFKLRLPHALPQIFVGLRIAASVVGLGTIAAEWTSAQTGLGVLLLQARRDVEMQMAFATLACLACTTLLVYGLVVLAERLVTFRPKILRTLSLLLILFLTACSTKPSSQPATRLLLDWTPNPNHVALYAGIEKGFFRTQGVELQLMQLPDPADIIPLLTSGKADLAIYYMYSAIRAQAKGARFTWIGSLVKQPLNGIIYRKAAGITTLETLNGHILGYPSGGFNAACLHALEAKGVRLEKSYRLGFDLVSAMATKQVDAILGGFYTIEMPQLAALGIETGFFPFSMIDMPLYYELIILAHPNLSADFAQRFRLALQASIDYCKAHPQEAFAAYVSANPHKSPGTLLWEKKSWEMTYPLLANNQEIDAHVWETFKVWLQKQTPLP